MRADEALEISTEKHNKLSAKRLKKEMKKPGWLRKIEIMDFIRMNAFKGINKVNINSLYDTHITTGERKWLRSLGYTVEVYDDVAIEVTLVSWSKNNERK